MTDEPTESPPPREHPAAALSRMRWEKTSPEQRTIQAREAVRKRWKGDCAGMEAYLRKIASLPRKRARNPDRCPCGRYTRVYAQRRKHRCEAK